MDKRLFKAKFFKYFLRMTYPKRLYRYNFTNALPSFARRIDREVMNGDDIVILPRDETVMIGRNIKEENIVLPSRLIDTFIDKSGYRCIMNSCICRDGSKCKDYPHELGCLFLGEAARDIHPDLGRSATKEEAKEHIRKCEEAGLIHLLGKGKFDTLWLDVYPGSKLMTICNCCPCCCITLVLPYLAPVLRDKITRMPGVRVEVTEECIGCGKCADSCVFGGLEMDGEKAFINEECRGCGRCIEACPQNAIELTFEDSNYVQTVIERLTPKVDVT